MLRDLVSVVIPAYRAEPFIGRAVLSVLRQSLARWEVVIASDDGMDYVEVLRGGGIDDPRVRCVSTGARGSGAAAARNAALDAARGRLVASLDADDQLAPAALERLAPLAARHGAAYARPRLVHGLTGAELESFDGALGSGPVPLDGILASQLHTYAGIVFDRTRVKARWPEWMRRWEDLFFYVRCFDDLERLYHVAEPLYTYHRTPGSICNRPETPAEFLEWADLLAGRLERGETLGLRNPGSRATLRRYLRQRHVMEAEYVAARGAGLDLDFHAFVRDRLETASGVIG